MTSTRASESGFDPLSPTTCLSRPNWQRRREKGRIWKEIGRLRDPRRPGKRARVEVSLGLLGDGADTIPSGDMDVDDAF